MRARARGNIPESRFLVAAYTRKRSPPETHGLGKLRSIIIIASGIPRPGRSLARILFACLVLACAAPASAEPVAASIGTTIAGVEWQLERVERCRARGEVLQRRLARLRTDPVTNAAAITDTQTRLDSNQRCVQSSTARASSLELSLASLREQLLSASKADAGALAAQVDALRAAERERAVLDLDIRLVQYQIDQLRLSVPINQSAIDQKIAVQDGTRSSLAASVSRIVAANQTLADFEMSALDVLANRHATLNWTTPTTRENGAPLAQGEIGGFEIYMLAESTGQTSVFTVDDPMLTTYTVDGLSPDTYHFSMSAFDIAGAFSPLSEVVSKAVR